MILSKEELLKFAFKRFLNTDAVEFVYFKADSTLRVAHGTLHPSIIESNGGKMPEGNKQNPDHLVTYFDIDKKAWRSFDINKLVEVKIEGEI